MYVLYCVINCKYCDKAKKLLDELNCDYVHYDVTSKKSETLDQLAEKTNNQRTFPVIFYDTHFIGGFTELKNKLDFEVLEDF